MFMKTNQVAPFRLKVVYLLLLVVFSNSLAALTGGFSGNIAMQGRAFFKPAADTLSVTGFPPQPNDQHQFYGALSAEPKYAIDWAEGSQNFTVELFGRYDYYDENRNHVDISELSYIIVGDVWELRAGIRKVFWGVTESIHLVDIINQTDFVDNPSGERKLGQTMVNLSLISETFGILDLFAMTGFRKRTFPGLAGRPRQPILIETAIEERYPFATDTGSAQFESTNGIWQPDFAARWFINLGSFDIGISQFYGTGRDPFFVVNIDGTSTSLIPRYELLTQTGLDMQYTVSDWLFKWEAIYRDSVDAQYFATAFGTEYTFNGIFGSVLDLGLLTEYLYDQRGDDFPTPVLSAVGNSGVLQSQPISFTPFQSDIFVGLRLAFNDTQSTDLLFGGIIDSVTGATLLQLEGSRRIGESFKLTVEAAGVIYTPSDDFSLQAQADDQYAQIDFAYYF